MEGYSHYSICSTSTQQLTAEKRKCRITGSCVVVAIVQVVLCIGIIPGRIPSRIKFVKTSVMYGSTGLHTETLSASLIRLEIEFDGGPYIL